MSFPITSTAYTPPTPLTVASSATASSINALFTNVNGINQALATLTGRNVLTTDGNLTLTQNRDTTIMMANTASRTVTLPSLSGQTVPILVQKTSENNLPIIVQRNTAGEFIDNPFSPKTSPVNINFTLFLPGESYLFIPMGTIWRVVTLNCPVDSYYTTVYRDGSNDNISTAIGDKVLLFNTVKAGSITSIYNTATGVFTPQIPGEYSVSGSFVFFESGGDTSTNVFIRQNGVTRLERTNFNTSFSPSGGVICSIGVEDKILMNGTTDYLSVCIDPPSPNPGILSIRTTTTIKYRLVSRI